MSLPSADRLVHLGHLVRRFRGSLSRRPPASSDTAWAESFLLPHELRLWRSMSVADRRHAVQVARRFTVRRPHAARAEMAGVLLHDVGKLDSGLGTLGRVVATVVGPRVGRCRVYHDHERLGADRLVAAGSERATVDLVRRRGPLAADLDAADDV